MARQAIRRSTVSVRRPRQVIDKNFVSLTEKVFAVLDTLSGSPEIGFSRAQIAQSVALSPPTLDRLLYSIQKLGYIEQGQGDNYRLARKFYDLSAGTLKYQYLPLVARSVFNRLLAEYGESVHISVLENDLCVTVAAVQSSHAFQCSAEVGEWNYAHSTAMGKCFLANLAVEQQDAIINHRGLPRLTSATITDREKLQAELEKVKIRGYAVSTGEGIEGVTCVASPIFNCEDQIIASISISGPSFRMQRNVGRITVGITQAATRLSILLGCRKSKLNDLLFPA